MAVAAAEPADHAGARHRRRGARPGDRHARPRLLRARQHRRAAPGRRPSITTSALHLFEPINPLRGRDRNVDVRLLPRKRSRRGQDRVPRRARARCSAPSPARRRTPTPPPASTRRRRSSAARRRASASQKGMNRFTWDLRYEGADRVPGHDHVGRAAAARPGRRRPATTPCASPPTARPRRSDFTIGIDPRLAADGITEADLLEQFKLSARSPRQGHRGQHSRDQHPQPARPGERAAAEGAAARRKAEIQKLADGAAHAAGGRGRRGLPGAEPQQPGSAELPDPVEQQDRGADGRDRKRRHQADRSEPTRCSRSCRRSSMRSCSR